MVKLRAPVWLVRRKCARNHMFGAKMPQELIRNVCDIAGAIKAVDEPNGIAERITKFARLHGRSHQNAPTARPKA
jgi:hypothetical protein